MQRQINAVGAASPSRQADFRIAASHEEHDNGAAGAALLRTRAGITNEIGRHARSGHMPGEERIDARPGSASFNTCFHIRASTAAKGVLSCLTSIIATAMRRRRRLERF